MTNTCFLRGAKCPRSLPARRREGLRARSLHSEGAWWRRCRMIIAAFLSPLPAQRQNVGCCCANRRLPFFCTSKVRRTRQCVHRVGGNREDENDWRSRAYKGESPTRSVSQSTMNMAGVALLVVLLAAAELTADAKGEQRSGTHAQRHFRVRRSGISDLRLIDIERVLEMVKKQSQSTARMPHWPSRLRRHLYGQWTPTGSARSVE